MPWWPVDEAHCNLPVGTGLQAQLPADHGVCARLPRRPVVSAFTATATREVRDDILDMLELREPTVVTTGL